MSRTRKKSDYLIKADVRIAANWETERIYVFVQKAYTLTAARESARRKIAKEGGYVGNLEVYPYAKAHREDKIECLRQNTVRKQQGRFLWLRKKKTKLVLDRAHHVLRVVRTTA